MAKVVYVDLATEQVDPFYANLQAGDRFTFSRIRKKSTLLSAQKISALAEKTYLKTIAAQWHSLNSTQQAAWKAAAATMNTKPYNLFVQDCAARFKAGLTGIATPNLLHQSFVGQLHIEAPATQLQILQAHPDHYYVSKKVPGFKNQYSPFLVVEPFSLPLEIGLNYKAELTAQGAGAYAKFYAHVHYRLQAVDHYFDLVVDLDLSSTWKTGNALLPGLVGQPISYDLYFDLFNVRGDLFVDHIFAEHNAVNWVRDPYCKNIGQEFSRAFYQVQKAWSPIIQPDGAQFGSVYKDF